MEGNKVSWQQWSFRVGFNFREGLVLHQVGYEDQGRVRPIVFRASMVEMAVPYAEPRAPYHRKCAFDVSDYGLGTLDERGREGGREGRVGGSEMTTGKIPFSTLLTFFFLHR